MPVRAYDVSVERSCRPVIWMGDSLQVVREFPTEVRREIGHAIYIAQVGGKHISARPLHGFGAAVLEIAIEQHSSACRAIYIATLGERLYVLHAFQKKAKKGIRTPRQEIELIRNRLRRALAVEQHGA